MSIFSVMFIAGGLIYIVFLKPYFEEKKNALEFDNRVIGFVDSLHLSGIDLGCSEYELRCYLKSQLEKAHKLPGNQSLIEYTTADGFHYCSHLGKEDFKLFALLCIAQYAMEIGNSKLIFWCESRMHEASRIRF